MPKELKKAFGYMRTSSATYVGEDKDSDKRQRAAIEAFAKRNGYELVEVFYDAAVSGADPIDIRPGFLRLLAAAKTPSGGGTTPPPAAGDDHPRASPEKKYILVEIPDRFARDLIVQLTGHDLLKAHGIELIPTTAPDFFTADTPTAVMVRQIMGSIAEFQRANLVAQLAGARARKKELTGRCEGRKPISATYPEAAALAKRLRRKKPKGGVMSLRAISAELAAQGHLNERGAPFNPRAVLEMVNS